MRRLIYGEVWCVEGEFSEVELPIYGVLGNRYMLATH